MIESQSAEQVTGMSIRISEEAIKLSALGAKHLAAFLIAVSKEGYEIISKSGLEKIVKSGELPAVIPLSKKELADFQCEAKKFNLKYFCVGDKNAEQVDIVLSQNDAEIMNCILGKIGYAPCEYLKEEHEPKKMKDPCLSKSELESPNNKFTENAKDTATSKSSVFDKVEGIKADMKSKPMEGKSHEK